MGLADHLADKAVGAAQVAKNNQYLESKGLSTPTTWYGQTSTGTTGTSSSSSGSSRSRSGGSSGGGLVAAGGGGGADYNAYLEQARAAAQKAYDAVMGAAGRMRDSAFGLADENYNYGSGRLNDASDKSLRESYIANELAKRNLNQRLAYTGRSGGAAETTLLGLENSYGTARGEVESSRQEGLAALAQQRAQERAAAEQMYQQYVMQAEENLANRLASYDTSAMNMMLNQARASSGSGGAATASALQKQYQAATAAAARQAATNSTVTGAGLVPATNAAASGNDLSVGLNLAKKMIIGQDDDQVAYSLRNRGYTSDEVARIMSQL